MTEKNLPHTVLQAELDGAGVTAATISDWAAHGLLAQQAPGAWWAAAVVPELLRAMSRRRIHHHRRPHKPDKRKHRQRHPLALTLPDHDDVCEPPNVATRTHVGRYLALPMPASWEKVLAPFARVPTRFPDGRELQAEATVAKVLERVPGRGAVIARVHDGDALTLAETGALIGVTPVRVRQVLGQVSFHLRRDPVAMQLLQGVLPSGDCPYVSFRAPPRATRFVRLLVGLAARAALRNSGLINVHADQWLVFDPEEHRRRVSQIRALRPQALFLDPAELARHARLTAPGVLALAALDPGHFRATVNGGLLFRGRPAVEYLVFAAQQLAAAGFVQWHPSQVAKAAGLLCPGLERQSPQNAADLLARAESAGRLRHVPLRAFRGPNENGRRSWRIG